MVRLLLWWPELNPACVVGLDALVTKEFSPKPLCHPHSTRYFSLRISLRIHHNGKSTGLARHQIGWNSPQMPNALTCCVP